MKATAALGSALLLAFAGGCSSFIREGTPNQLSSQERADGWRLLFDGESLRGWRGYRASSPPAGWIVEDGALSLAEPGAGDLISVEQYENFILELEWRISPGGNSGIFYRGTEEHGSIWATAPEMQVLDNQLHADGASPFTSAGACYGLYAPETDVTRPVGEWNRVRIEARGDLVRHWLNGRLLFEYSLGSDDWESRVAASKFNEMPDYGRRSRGHIALQDHQDPVWYRDIRIQVL